MLKKIISGGQTGVDRAALDFAIERDIEHGGWIPFGRRTENGPLDARYALQETPDTAYIARTRLNVINSDGTLIVNAGEITSGTLLTKSLTDSLNKPCFIFQVEADQDRASQVEALASFISEHNIETLNVAGPRESKCPGIYLMTSIILVQYQHHILSETPSPSYA